MYHLKVVAANIAYLATEFFPKKEGMEKMERHFFAVRALVGYWGIWGILEDPNISEFALWIFI